MAWGDDDGGDKKKGCFKCGEEDPGDLRAKGRRQQVVRELNCDITFGV